jgi:cytochrome c oxidase accessory protein FixG
MSSPPVRPSASPAPSLESVTTIRADGSHVVLHPADVAGRFTRGRRVAAAGLIALYLALPWIPVGGHPAVFLDVAARRFHLFGSTLAAQDLWLLFFLISGFGFTLFFLTALLGRVWCGWACPQTVFLDHVYRRVERWIEGDAVARRALDAAPWTGSKVARRAVKHGVFALLSLFIAHLFLAYFVSIPQLWGMMRAAPAEHGGVFLFVFVFAGVLYFNFAWFREQLCIVLCPYGRLQSALIDDHSLVIGYDGTRGEPRGRRRQDDCRAGSPEPAAAGMAASGDAALHRSGDCVDCGRCVAVCPTGIDIRQGLQIECIGCAACIDACDDVMARLGRPRGLVRYDSLAGLGGARTRWARPRAVVYAVLLLIGAAVASWAFSTVRPAAFGVTRMIGAAYYFDAATVRNQFLVRLVNKRDVAEKLVVKLRGAPPEVVQTGLEEAVELAGMGEEVRPLIVAVPRDRYTGSFRFTVVVSGGGGAFELTRDVQFLGPDPRLLREEQEAREKHPDGGAPMPLAPPAGHG